MATAVKKIISDKCEQVKLSLMEKVVNFKFME